MNELTTAPECGIDRKAFGEYLRAMRKQGGFRNTESFSKALRERAGYHVSADTIYRIESGKQEASVSYVCAASIALSGDIFSFSLLSLLKASACDEWRQIQEETDKKWHKDHTEISEDGMTIRFF